MLGLGRTERVPVELTQRPRRLRRQGGPAVLPHSLMLNAIRYRGRGELAGDGGDGCGKRAVEVGEGNPLRGVEQESVCHAAIAANDKRRARAAARCHL